MATSMSSSTPVVPEHYIKVLQALQYVCYTSVPSLDSTIQKWHSNQIQNAGLQQCTLPKLCSTNNGKPKKPKSCQHCVSSGNAVESVYYPPRNKGNLTWRNIDTTELFGNPIEVSKAFALNLPSGKGITSMSDHDIASILKIMCGFGYFHQNNAGTQNCPDPYNTIHKMTEIRNSLSHRPLSSLDIDEKTFDTHFHDILALVCCLEDLHHVTPQEATDMRTKLDKIRASPLSLNSDIRQEIHNVIKDNIADLQSSLVDRLEPILKGTDEIIDIVKDTKKGTDEILANVKDIKKGMDRFLRSEEDDEIQEFPKEVKSWRSRLTDTYLQRRKKIQFGHAIRQIADPEDIFVDLTLLHEHDEAQTDTGEHASDESKPEPSVLRTKSREQKSKPLQSYQELLTLNTKHEPVSFILIRGKAGSGKTTLLSRIAYEWAKLQNQPTPKASGTQHTSRSSQNTACSSHQDPDIQKYGEEEPWASWDRFVLLFVLQFRKISPGESLERAIVKQLLPGIKVDRIGETIGALGMQCLFLLDGFDEMSFESMRAQDQILESPLLDGGFVIMTSRPHMVNQISSMVTHCTHVENSGFTLENSFKYIRKFFVQSKHPRYQDLTATLTAKLAIKSILQTLSSIPILLVMICHIWLDEGGDEFTCSFTSLFLEAIKYLNKPFIKSTIQAHDVDKVIQNLGKAALEGLFENNIQINQNRFEDTDSLEQSFKMGLCFKEDGSRIDQTYVIFIHKTFQEFCAAKYLNSLATTNEELFLSHLRSINKDNLSGMEYLIRFCCGFGTHSVHHILLHCRDLMPEESKLMNLWRLLMLLLYETVYSHNALVDYYTLNRVFEPLTHFPLVIDPELMPAFTHFVTTEPDDQTWLKYVTILSLQILPSIDINMIVKYCARLTSLHAVLLIRNNEIVDEMKSSIPVLNTSAVSLTIESCNISSNTLLRLMGFFECLKKVELINTNLPGDLDAENMVSCESLIEFIVSNVTICVDTLLMITNCMPKLQSMRLNSVYLTGSELNSNLSSRFRSLLTVTMSGKLLQPCKISAAALMRYLICANSVQKTIEVFEFDEGAMHLNTAMGILQKMPNLKQLQLCKIDLHGKLTLNRLVELKSLKKLMISGRIFKITLEKLISFLKCMPALEELSVDRVCLVGQWDMRVSVLCRLLKKIYICNDGFTSGCDIDASVLIRFLGSMPKLEKVVVAVPEVVGNIETNLTVCCKSIRQYIITGPLPDKQCSVSGDNVLRWLYYMPSLAAVRLERVDLIRHYCSHQTPEVPTCSCMALSMIEGSAHANLLQKFLSCMPSLHVLSIQGIKLTGVLDTLVTYPMLESSSMSGTKEFDLQVNIGVLTRMPQLTSLTLENFDLRGSLHGAADVDCESLEEVRFCRGKFSTGAFFDYLTSLPSLRSLTLDRVGGKIVPRSNVSIHSLREFHLGNVVIKSPKILLKIIRCMKSLESWTIDGVNVTDDDFDRQTSDICKSVQLFVLTNSKLKVQVFLKLLACMPTVQRVKLHNMTFSVESLTDQTYWELLNQFHLHGSFFDENCELTRKD